MNNLINSCRTLLREASMDQRSFKEYSAQYPHLSELVKILNKYRKLYPTPKKNIKFVHGLHYHQPAHNISYQSSDKWTISVELQAKWNGGYSAVVRYTDMHRNGAIYLIKSKAYTTIESFFKDLVIVSDYIKKHQKKEGNSLDYDKLDDHTYPIPGV